MASANHKLMSEIIFTYMYAYAYGCTAVLYMWSAQPYWYPHTFVNSYSDMPHLRCQDMTQ